MATVFLVLLVWSFRVLEIERFFFFGWNLLMRVSQLGVLIWWWFYFGLSKMKISVFFFFNWKNMGMVDKIVTNVDVKKMELKNRCEGKKKVFGEVKKWPLIKKSRWGWRRKERAFWSINGSCASHMITNGENGREIWQKGQSAYLIKGREWRCTFLKCKV